MTSIDFKQKLSDAHEMAYSAEQAIFLEFSEQNVDLNTLFLELSYAAEERGAEVSVGTVDELRAVLLSDPYLPQGSLTAVGPSLSLVMQGKARKFCLGVDFDCDLDGGDGKKLRLLSWSGCWPDCTFDGDRGVSSIEEFFDELVEEITAAQQQAETVARIYEERDRRSLQAIKPPSSTSFWDRAAGICLLAAIILSVYAADGKILLAGGSISGIVLLWTGLLNLKWQSESSRPMWSRGWWRVAAGAGLIAMPAINGMLVNDINISAAINCNIAACPGF